MQKPTNELSQEMVDSLQGKTIVLLNLFDRDSGQAYTSALSWVYGVDRRTIRFAIDSKSDAIAMIDKDPRINLAFIGLESVYNISGKAAVKTRVTENISLKMAVVEVKVEEVRDIIFYGGKIVTDPAFIKTYKEELIVKLDNEIKGVIFGE